MGQIKNIKLHIVTDIKNQNNNKMVLFADEGDNDDAKLTCLVADSAAFLRNVDLQNLSQRIFTIKEVVGEIRDSATKQRLAVLPYDLNFRTPSAESIQFVTEFSKKTGDYKALSAVDIRVIALTYQLEKEFGDASRIKSEPTRKAAVVDKTNIRSDKEISGFYVESRKQKEGEVDEEKDLMETEKAEDVEMEATREEEDDDLQEMGDENDNTENKTGGDGNENTENKTGGDEEIDEDSGEGEDDDEDEDGGGWITPKNLDQVNQTFGASGGMKIAEADIKCACLTTDFAMQNVLIQMGLHVLSVEGMLIRQARSYIQKCFGCYKETHDMTRVFCSSCGNKTLKKVAVTVAEDGTMQYHYPRRQRNPNIRGTKFSIPAPKGGRHVGVDQYLLVEDQPTGKNHLPKSRDKADPMDPNYCARGNPFSTNDVTSRAFNLGLHLKQKQPRNPNESRKKKSGRKKK